MNSCLWLLGEEHANEETHGADHLIHICCQWEDSLPLLVSPFCQFTAFLHCNRGCIIDLKSVWSYQGAPCNPHCALEFTVFLSGLCFTEDLKEKHQPILSELMSCKDEGQKHTTVLTGLLCEKCPPVQRELWQECHQQFVLYQCGLTQHRSTVFSLSQGCIGSLCFIFFKKMF